MSTRGGARPGAGRKPLGRKALMLTLDPKTEAKIRAEAEAKKLTLGAVVDRKFKTK
jgi:hypothetical protein